MQIPFIDLRAQYESIKHNIDNALVKSVESFQFCKGKEVAAFETEFAKLLHTKNCIGTGNGTDALFISLKALGIGYQDEVITPAFSWISSAEVISLCRALPVFADVDAHTYTLDPKSVEKKITPKTRAVITVHLYGQTAHVSELQTICKQHNLYFVEDCAQSHLSAQNNQYSGTFGDAAAFSFYPTKNLGAYGDAGCVITGNDALAEKIRRLANHGALIKDDHEIEGMNSRLDTLQAAVLLAKLPHLQKWNEQRIKNALLYSHLLKDVSQITTPHVRKDTSHTFHMYVIKAEGRNDLQGFLRSQGIQTIIHYPRAIPDLPAYKHLRINTAADFPVSHALQHQVLSLPIYPELQENSIHYVTEKIKEFYNN